MPSLPRDYESRLYAGVLGKVIGVYLGRPVENWPHHLILERFGSLDRYVAPETGGPIVVADDDITGTFAFIRALAESGRFADATAADFAECWLNAIVPNKSILWWGGRGISTEHTAWLNLAEGVAAPESGSCRRNGQTVAEQIGAQIFIDAVGLVLPGDPARAAALARQAASVSHDGAAVHAAQVVAALVSGAFIEPDMDRLLDTAIALVPADGIIARIHREVRAWCRAESDWRAVRERIQATYGYDRFGGGCHVVPNHAIMVMAWCLGRDSFKLSQTIINSAGWDTDCNAANVGSVMGVRLGLDGINRDTDWQAPFGDRVLLPTAATDRGVSDCLEIARDLAAVGRRIAGMAEPAPPKGGARWHFSQPRAFQGFLAEAGKPGARPAATLSNPDGAALQVRVDDMGPKRDALIACPVLATPTGGGYAVMGAPRLWPGQSVTLTGSCRGFPAGATVRLAARHWEGSHGGDGTWWSRSYPEQAEGEAAGPVVALRDGPITATLTIPDLGEWPVADLLVRMQSDIPGGGELRIDAIAVSGQPRLRIAHELPRTAKWATPGWIVDADEVRRADGTANDRCSLLTRSVGRGHLVTGGDGWADYTAAATLRRGLAARFGLAVRWQGLRRHLAVIADGERIALVERLHGERVLAEAACPWPMEVQRRITVNVRGDAVQVGIDGQTLFAATTRLAAGGLGILVEAGTVGFRAIEAG
jgi:ADP-ribosylglycohydrolase